jgi:hypothetical protein
MVPPASACEFSSVACADVVSVRKLPLISLRQSLLEEHGLASSRERTRLARTGDIV